MTKELYGKCDCYASYCLIKHRQLQVEYEAVKKENQALQYEIATTRKEVDHLRDSSELSRTQLADQTRTSKQVFLELDTLRKDLASEKVIYDLHVMSTYTCCL